MASIMWACWDGGGNLTPSLGIARELTDRGHDVHFFGRPAMLGRVEAAGFSATALNEARTDLARYSFHPMAEVFGYTSSPSVGEELVGVTSALTPDVVVIDAMFSAALDVAPRFGRPTAVMLHTLFDSLWAMWQANFTMQSESRVKAGFSGLPPLESLWGDRDLLHVNALREFDGTPMTAWEHVVHGAPVLAAESRAVPVELPWESDDPTPLVLLSFSTVAEQRSPEMLQRALDALATLPVHVVATTGSIVEPTELAIPVNAHVVAFADHDLLMDRASVLVGHGGHGTTMRALRHGLPMVGIPAKGGDQAPITQMLDGWGVGIALSADASVMQIRSAAHDVLSDDTFAEEARKRSPALENANGAALAADSVVALIRSTASH
jgi:UDP:flavonoid glycosyltransferase YjiC (YdhE family)